MISYPHGSIYWGNRIEHTTTTATTQEGTKHKFISYINECDKAITSCGNHTKCNNELNGFSCQCLTGFKDFVDGNGCSDIDECSELGNVCVANAGCINSIGGYTCQCNAGYQGFLQRKFREIATLN